MTKKFIYTIFLLLFFASCQTHSKKIITPNIKPDSLQDDTIILKDSLDNERKPKNYRKHSDSASILIGQLNDTLWKYINESLVNTKKFPNPKFYDIIKQEGFEIDSTDNYFFSSKRIFNSRLNIQFNLKKTDTILTYVKIWYKGQSYETLFAKWENSFE